MTAEKRRLPEVLSADGRPEQHAHDDPSSMDLQWRRGAGRSVSEGVVMHVYLGMHT